MFGLFKNKNKKDKVTQIKEEKNTVANDKGLEQIKVLLASKKLPIVVLDSLWYQMRDVLSHTDLTQKETELRELLKEQGKLNNDIKEYNVVKQNLLQKVLVISQEVNEQGSTNKVEELDKVSQAITKANETVEQLESRAIEVDDLIDKINKEIIESVVMDAYGSMEAYKVQKKQVEDEIDRLRKEVVEKTEEKKQYDHAITTIYNYLHKMIGYKYLDKVDHKLGE